MHTITPESREDDARIDRHDLAFAAVVGCVAAFTKFVLQPMPALQISRITQDDLCSVLVVGYIFYRARRAPALLDRWGLTTRLTPSALLVALLLLIITVAALMFGGLRAAGSVSWHPEFPARMTEYIVSAFPQQFFLCSVGLISLGTFPIFRGQWRLPLAVGLAFSLAHFWTPHTIPGTIIPVQMVITFPAGFLAAWYFLRYRSILPLVAVHAIAYPLLNTWIERHL